MYCVKCGVRLKDGTDRCPLCGLPTWKPEGMEQLDFTFPGRYPKENNSPGRKAALFLTIATAVAALVVLIVWLAVGKGRPWGGIALFGIAAAWMAFTLPLWIRRCPLWVWFLTVHIIAEGYCLYLCYITGGHWFLPFAFPVLGIHGILTMVTAILLRCIHSGRCYIWGGTLIAYGGYTMLVELFLHIAFHLPMFRWSIFSAATLAGLGLLLIVIGIVKPFKRFLHKNLFF